MLTLISAFLPIVCIITLGYLLKYFIIFDSKFWSLLSKLVFYIFIPVLLFNSLSRTSLINFGNINLIIAFIVSILIISILLYLTYIIFNITNFSFSSVFQGGTRFNIFIGLAIANSFFGNKGVELASLAILGLTPLLNLLCVTVVTQHGDRREQHYLKMVLNVLKNPMILGCIFGLLFNILSIMPPAFLNNTLDMLSDASLPLGLLIVGAGLQLSFDNLYIKGIILSSLIKLMLHHSIMLILCIIFNINGLERDIAILFTALPTAVGGYILAKELGGNAELMAQIITSQVLISVFTLPMVLFLLIN